MVEITKAFRTAFENEYVQVVLKDIHAYIMEKQPDGVLKTRGSAAYEGVFLDYDDKFLYIGTAEGEIETAINLQTIATVTIIPSMIIDEKDMAFFSLPEKDEDLN